MVVVEWPLNTSGTHVTEPAQTCWGRGLLSFDSFGGGGSGRKAGTRATEAARRPAGGGRGGG